jgi:hypothetical protein
LPDFLGFLGEVYRRTFLILLGAVKDFVLNIRSHLLLIRSSLEIRVLFDDCCAKGHSGCIAVAVTGLHHYSFILLLP